MALAGRTLKQSTTQSRIDWILDQLDEADREWLHHHLTDVDSSGAPRYVADTLAAELADEFQGRGQRYDVSATLIRTWRRKNVK